jgi:hypothetical protein
MITIHCKDCGNTVAARSLQIEGCPVCRKGNFESAGNVTLRDFTVVEKVVSPRASNYYVFDNTKGVTLTQFAYGRREDAEKDASSRMPEQKKH